MLRQKKHNETNKHDSRISLFIVLFTILLSVIIVKLFDIQVLDSSKYRLVAKKQYERNIPLIPLRGIIYDRKMNFIITNANQFTFAADPNMIDNKDSVAEIFAGIFQKEKNFYLNKLNSMNTSFVWLERHVDSRFDEAVRYVNIPGVIKQTESRRIISENGIGSQIIGVTDMDGKGISGIELEYDEILRGSEGYIVMQKDGLGRKRPAVEYPRIDPQNGNNLVLTIDLDVQKIIEEELGAGVNANNAEGGKCVVMSVSTGEILGLFGYASEVSGESGWRNKLSVITDIYEPGSTFKIVTASSSLEEAIENKTSIIETHGGEYTVNGVNFKDSHKSPLSMTFQDVIAQSSNIGTIRIAERLGSERFYKYARDFGFGISTGIDLPGEVKGSLKKPVDYSAVSLSYMAIGYELLVNALQMTNAYCCIANDGVLMKPFIVKKLLTPDGKVIKENFPIVVRQVVSKNTAMTMTELFTGVVERGTGKDAKIEGMMVAGKTGTSQKFVEGKYSKKSYTSSFIGYFPADNPQIVISVIIDSPSAGEIYGGKVAAPIFKKIAERIILLSGLLESLESNENSKPVDPDGMLVSDGLNQNLKNINSINLLGLEIESCVRLLNEKNFDFEIHGVKTDAVVIKQELQNSEDGKSKFVLFTSNIKDETEKVSVNNYRMPDLSGLSLRKCINKLSRLGIDYNVSGSGKVIGQKPEAGSSLTNQKVLIICDNSN